MVFKKDEYKKIMEIHMLYTEIHNKFLELSKETRDKIYDFHNEHYSLNHCISWGIQATEELLKEGGKL